MRALLLSAYDAASHRRWREGLTEQLSEVDWTVRCLPPRHFAWRIRGNPLSWWADPGIRKSFQVLVATSMVDLSSLRGLIPVLARVPTLLYFHENQFAYPRSSRQSSLLEAQMVQLYAALSAQALVFNSGYNRDTFLDGVETLLARFPDQVPAGVVEHLANRSRVLPVGLEVATHAAAAPAREPLKLVWNHRWEQDKGPDRLLAFLQALDRRGLAFRISVLGQQFRRQPPAFATIQDQFGDRLDAFGHEPDRNRYRQRLAESHLVLSTALHEFQGLAVQEAVALGCRPLVPDRLAYREQYADPFRYPSHPDDGAAEALAMAAQVSTALAEAVPDLSHLDWRPLAKEYRAVLDALTRKRSESD